MKRLHFGVNALKLSVDAVMHQEQRSHKHWLMAFE